MIGNAVIRTWQDMGYLNPEGVVVSAYTMGAQVTPLTKCQVVWQDSPLPLQQGDDLRDRLTFWLIAPASQSGNKQALHHLEQDMQMAILGSLGDPRFYGIVDPDDGHSYSDVRIYPDSSAQTQTPPLSGVQAATITCQVIYRI